MNHIASVERSERLRRILEVLRAQPSITSRQLLYQSRVVALSAAINELRCQGYIIHCSRASDSEGTRRWLYRLMSEPKHTRKTE